MFRRRQKDSVTATTAPPSTSGSYCSSFFTSSADIPTANASTDLPRSSRFSRFRLRRPKTTLQTSSATSCPETNTKQTGTDWTYALTLTAAGIATALFTGYTLHHCATNFSDTLGRDPLVSGALMVAGPGWGVGQSAVGTLGSVASAAGRGILSVAIGD